MDTLEYLDKIDDFQCVICLNPWTNPSELNCGHIFCSECISAAVKACPTCRAPFDRRTMKPPNRLLVNMLNAAKVKCTLCSWTGTREAAPDHPCTDVSKRPPPVMDWAKATSNGSNNNNNPATPTLTHRQRVMRMYNHYCPDKIASVDSVIAKYAGQEDQLISALIMKYGPEPTTDPRDDLRQRVERIYRNYCPEKLSSIDSVLQKYADRPEDLISALVAKYGPEPGITTTVPTSCSVPATTTSTSPPRPPSTTTPARARLENFFRHYNPSKLSDIDRILSMFNGREDELFSALVMKYGPEPAPAPWPPQPPPPVNLSSSYNSVPQQAPPPQAQSLSRTYSYQQQPMLQQASSGSFYGAPPQPPPQQQQQQPSLQYSSTWSGSTTQTGGQPLWVTHPHLYGGS